MAAVNLARVTHDYDGELVVFLIGMRINKLHRPDLWLPTLRAMPTMLAELSKDPDSGLLGYSMSLGANGPVLVADRTVLLMAMPAGRGTRPASRVRSMAAAVVVPSPSATGARCSSTPCSRRNVLV